MTLTADLIFEIERAIGCGLKEASLARLSVEEKASWLAEVKMHAERRLTDPAFGHLDSERMRESVEFADRPREHAERMRARYYAQPLRERSRNLKGKKMGLNDHLSQTHYYSPEQRAAVDACLAERGLPNLRQLEVRLKRTHERILKRGKIRSEEEYHVVREILADVSFAIPEPDRARFEHLAAVFEGRTTR